MQEENSGLFENDFTAKPAVPSLDDNGLVSSADEKVDDNSAEVSNSEAGNYDDDSIQHLEWNEHIRRRSGMYINSLGDGSHYEDGIYVLLKEVIDNSVDEFNMGAGTKIEIQMTEEGEITVRDYGRGIPLGKVREVASQLNTGGKFDDKNFKKSAGLNGVGLKAVNAMSETFHIESVRDGKKVSVDFEKGNLRSQTEPTDTDELNGTLVRFKPDDTLFRNFKFKPEFVELMVNNYSYLNVGLKIFLNGRRYWSKNGLLDLLKDNITAEPLYPYIHLKGEDIEVVITHADQYGEEYYSFVNGQHTTQGGTHLTAFKEHVSRTIKEYSGKGFEYSDIRNGMIAAVSVKVQEPMFDSQAKKRFTGKEIGPKSTVTVNKFVGDFLKKALDDYLHKHQDVADAMLKKIAASEKERKALAGVAKSVRERNKKANLHNRKLRDCRIHFNDSSKSGKTEDKRDQSSIFITEGDSASGTITKVRDAETQAVFSLRGKPMNTYGKTQKDVYENEEFSLLQAALNIEDGLDSLRYNKIIIATDADVDGMHIRLLVITYFLMFFPELVKKGHVYILQTPLFRVRDKNAVRRNKSGKTKKKTEGEKDTYYCYTDEERERAIKKFGSNAEITRFKGLGEINDVEFAEFIGPEMRLDPVTLKKDDLVDKLLQFYMGTNTMERQNFIIDNLIVEDDSQI